MLVNLATNARDAMASGGVLRIATAPVELDAAACAAQGWGTPGRYVQVSVSDDGIGMDDATRERIFEPFFTTKEPGKGTGLGLAMVYVLMQQHHGFVGVTAAPGRGTDVRLLFPLAVAESADAPSHARPLVRPTGNETVLVVEDELMVREAARAVLDSAGYRVLVARDGHEASALLESGQARIDLVVTDVVMPRCNGAQLYAVARRLPRAPLFLFTSGYADLGSRPLPGGSPFLAKPWTDIELLVRVRDVLDGARAPVGFGRPPASGPALGT
jgi:CheY-like chemotaxis protein